VIFFSFAHIASTKSSVERGIDVARESKPGKKEIKTICQRDPRPAKSKLLEDTIWRWDHIYSSNPAV
jgi:hypothetical protein